MKGNVKLQLTEAQISENRSISSVEAILNKKILFTPDTPKGHGKHPLTDFYDSSNQVRYEASTPFILAIKLIS